MRTGSHHEFNREVPMRTPRPEHMVLITFITAVLALIAAVLQFGSELLKLVA